MKKYILAGIGLMVMSGFQLAYAQEEQPSSEQPAASQPTEDAAAEESPADNQTEDAAAEEAPAEASPATETVQAPLPTAEAAAPEAPPQGPKLRGRVVNAQSQTPLAGADVRIQGTQLRTVTDETGAFTIDERPPGSVEVIASVAGYESASLTVSSDQNDLQFDMKLSSLEELLVVGRATGIERRRVTNSIARVTAENISRTPAENIIQALQGKVAGANIQTNSGAPGGGIQIRLRGVSTVNGLSNPLYVVDGVLVSDAAIPPGLFLFSFSSRGSANTQTQDNQVNRIADLNPYDIADVQILKGASAAAIYGSKASNGVVVITTKRGDADDPRIDVTQRIGFNDLANTIGSRQWTREDAVARFGQDLVDQFFVDGQTFDHEEEYAGQNGLLVETAISLSGGDDDTDYYVGLLNRSDEGIVPGTKYEKQSARITLGHNFSDRLDLVGSLNVIHSLSDRGVSNNDNRNITPYFVFGRTPSFYSFRPNSEGIFPFNPFRPNGSNPLQTASLVVNEEEVYRFIGSLQANLTLYDGTNSQFRLFGVAGIDRFDQSNELDFPPALFIEQDDNLPGAALNTESTAQNYNFSVNAIHEFLSNSKDFGLTTSAGFQFESREVSTVYTFADNLTAGQPDVDSGIVLQTAEIRRLIEDFGAYVQEEAVLFDDLTLVGAVRFEQSSANGNPDKFFAFPKAAASYAIPGMPSEIDLLKLRLAYGESGNLPTYGLRFTTFDATQSIAGSGGVVSRGQLGNSELTPERQREFETGIDVSLFQSKVNFEFTFYQRNISDLILQRAAAPSTGVTTEVINGGELRNRGVEITLDATPIRNQGGFTWNSIITFAHNRSEILDLPVPPFLVNGVGFGADLGTFEIRPGRSATQIIGNRPDGTQGQIGDGAPDFRLGFLNTVRYDSESYGSVTLSFLLDWQQGSDVINLTQFIYDIGANSTDFEAGAERLANQGTDTSVYVYDATFVKLRELSIFYDLPAEWVDFVPLARELRLGFTGRNLFQITDYPGLDPEVSNFGNQAIGRNIDVAPFPPNRTFWFSLRASF